MKERRIETATGIDLLGRLMIFFYHLDKMLYISGACAIQLIRMPVSKDSCTPGSSTLPVNNELEATLRRDNYSKLDNRRSTRNILWFCSQQLPIGTRLLPPKLDVLSIEFQEP